MVDDAREYLRAAQAAEIRGDKLQAIELLMKAATVYRTLGNPTRALQMLRHARRLDDQRQDLIDEVKRLEWLPEHPLRRAINPEEDAEEVRRALAPLDDAPGPPRQLVERGPTKADPSLAAWCSFCCRPSREVGELVAGPAGAFICGACLGESSRLLGTDALAKAEELASWENRPTDRMPRPSFDSPEEPSEPEGEAARDPEPQPIELVEDTNPGRAAPRLPPLFLPALREPAAVELIGQAEAIASIEAAVRLGARFILLLGPEGSGKTTGLRELERRGMGKYVTHAAMLAQEGRLLVDLDRVGEAARELLELARSDRPLVLAARGEAPRPSLTLRNEELEWGVYSTDSIVGATAGALSQELAEQVQAVVPFRPLSREELIEIARRLMVRRAAELDLSDELLAVLAEEAAASGRGGRELEVLVERLPPGSWALPKGTQAQKPKRRRGRRKEAGETRRGRGAADEGS